MPCRCRPRHIPVRQVYLYNLLSDFLLTEKILALQQTYCHWKQIQTADQLYGQWRFCMLAKVQNLKKLLASLIILYIHRYEDVCLPRFYVLLFSCCTLYDNRRFNSSQGQQYGSTQERRYVTVIYQSIYNSSQVSKVYKTLRDRRVL